MALGAPGERQAEFWIETEALVKSGGNPFYQRLDELLRECGFEAKVNELCRKFYADDGRPGIPPPVYFKMLMIGYFEGLDSERGIAWRCADSLSLREFLGYELTERTPDHSSLSRIRQRIDLETHQTVFRLALEALSARGLLKGKTLGVDGTTLEANAALRGIVRRDTGETYNEFLTELAKASGIETPTREDLARLDRTRKNKGSNDDWQSPVDGEAHITKMKDGSTHLAHKAEHAVDMESGAVVAVTLHPGTTGDTTTLPQTLAEANKNLAAVSSAPDASGQTVSAAEETVADKGYHSNDVLADLAASGVRSYISEPQRGPRKWDGKEPERAAVYGNRRRIKGSRGKRLMRKRGELIERSFAHCYETGGMRRLWLIGRENILKRLLMHIGAFNWSLILRQSIGHGTPKELANAENSPKIDTCGVLSVHGDWEWLTGIWLPGANGYSVPPTPIPNVPMTGNTRAA